MDLKEREWIWEKKDIALNEANILHVLVKYKTFES